MKTGWIKKALSVVLAGAMVVCLSAAAGVPGEVYAEEERGKYISEVFIAYGKNEDKAAEWLDKHGWEPIAGDFNAGKASFWDDNTVQDQNVAAVMGIKRTNDKNQAITDMAVMNMKGGYSLPDYESLVNEKKSEIKEFVNNFMVVIEEFRANKNGEGSDFGKQRAELAFDILNRFTDGGEDEPYARNDTGLPLGELFLGETVQEGNKDGGDLEQMILESSAPAMTMVELLLAFSSDASQDTWLERAAGLTGDELADNLVKYAPEAEGQDVAPSAIPQYLGQTYGDAAAVLAAQWGDIHDQMVWYESYCEENGLWPEDGEEEDAYDGKVNAHFDQLEKSDPDAADDEKNKFTKYGTLYDNLYECAYVGDWGETLGDFFNPADEAYAYPEDEAFLPMAAALSDGQRAALDFLSLQSLLMIGFADEEGFKEALPDVEEVLGDESGTSIYLGVNRAAFRGNVALTSEALMEQNAGKGNAYDEIWDNTGIVAITSYCAAAVGAVTFIAGAVMAAKGWGYAERNTFRWWTLKGEMEQAQKAANSAEKLAGKWKIGEEVGGAVEQAKGKAQTAQKAFEESNNKTYVTDMGTAGRWMMGIGGAILLAAAIVKGVQLYMYYDRDMIPIPRMIVDESDVVTYLTDDNGKPLLDENGNQKKNIDFKTYEYYTAVQCNRPDVGEIGDWNDGVSDYKNPEHYCFDIADLNADMGQEWIALYTVKSQDKGDPILADTLTLKYGKNKDLPERCTRGLHLFTYSNAVDLGDTAWAYNNGRKGVRLYWGEDEGAFAATTASAFGAGQMALAGIGGLILGIAGATLVLKKKRRKEDEAAA